MTSDQDKPEPAIDPRDVARLARELFFNDPECEGYILRQLAERYLREEHAYLASHGIPSAEDPRALRLKLNAANADAAFKANEAIYWRERALAAEPTREQRLVRVALELKALGLDPFIGGDAAVLVLGLARRALLRSEAAAVRAALEERADG